MWWWNQNRPKAWHTTLYFTPAAWSPLGEVRLVDGCELGEVIWKLRRNGVLAQPGHATPIHFIRVLDDNTALYGRGVHPVHGGGTLYRVRWLDSGEYEWEEVRNERPGCQPTAPGSFKRR